MRRLFMILGATLAIGAGLVRADAQTYPTKTVRIVVPYGPGGGVSLLAQQVGQKMQELMKQPVVVDNRPGAGVFAAMNQPCQELEAKPGTPLSATVGISGTVGERLAPVMARPRMRPSWMSGAAVASGTTAIST